MVTGIVSRARRAQPMSVSTSTLSSMAHGFLTRTSTRLPGRGKALVKVSMVDENGFSYEYAELEVDDMLNGIAGKPDASAELILAADAMVYIADLAPVLAEARRVLVAGGVFAFTTETHDGEGVILGEGLRYAHSAAHVRATVAAAGLTLALLDDLSARNEDNIPAPGLVAVAVKP